MDINFHYYAVKTIARKAGFPETDAQTIAAYSQFVDDYSNYMYMWLDSVPPFAQHLATKIPLTDKWLFNPVTTGFESFFDMSLLAVPSNQRNILIPFHFIPPHKKLNEQVSDRTEWRVVPAKLNLNSLIQELLIDAGNKYKANRTDKTNLIRIGALLHIFADTYAHQNFSGFWNWENHSKLISATNNVNESDVTSGYSPDMYFQFPSIGHTNVNHAPDDSNVSFRIELKLNESDNYSIKYQRSNTRDYLIASSEILNFLLSCLDKAPISIPDWEVFSRSLSQGFLTDRKSEYMLNEHWKAIFPDIDYQYSKNSQLNSLLEIKAGNEDIKFFKAIETSGYGDTKFDSTLYEVKSDDFYHYNVIADEIRKFVNGGTVVDLEWEQVLDKMRG